MAGWMKTPVLVNSADIGVAAATVSFSPNLGSCELGTTTCLAFNVPQAVNVVSPHLVLLCTINEAGETGSKCYKAVFSKDLQSAVYGREICRVRMSPIVHFTLCRTSVDVVLTCGG
jgi:hypothetical protein